MSDKPAPAAAASEKKPAAAAAAAAAGADSKGGGAHGKKPAGKGGALLTKTPVLIAAVMAVEGIALIAGFKTLGGGPRNATASLVLDHDGAAGDARGEDGKAKGGAGGRGAAKETVELPVCEMRAPNKKSGRTFLYDVSIYVVARSDQSEKLKALFSANDALIKDRVRTIIEELEPDKLDGGSEPGLETLRRQVRYQLDQIVGDGLVSEVLVPRCMPFRTDY